MTIENTSTIYNTPGVYNQGQGGGGGGGSAGISDIPYYVWGTGQTHILINKDYIVGVTFGGSAPSESWRYGVCPGYTALKTWNDLQINDEVELNEIVNIPRLGTSITRLFGPSNFFGSVDSERYKFEINDYDGKALFSFFGNNSTSFSFDYNTDVNIKVIFKKIDSSSISVTCEYNGQIKLQGTYSIPVAAMNEMCLPLFGNGYASYSMQCVGFLKLGSYVKFNNDILFGKT